MQETKFRQESFFEFIKKTKLPFFFGWILNIVFIALCLLIVLQTYRVNPKATIGGLVFIIIGFIGVKTFLYGYSFKLYSEGGKIWNELSNKKKIILEDIDLYIKGYDIFDLQKKFPPDSKKTIYDFNKADLIIADNSIILAGKSDYFGGTNYAYPVEITNAIRLTKLTCLKVTKWKELNGRIEMEVKDPNYKKVFIIEFKKEIEIIKQWLTRGHI